jgi:hypothetical protein
MIPHRTPSALRKECSSGTKDRFGLSGYSEELVLMGSCEGSKKGTMDSKKSRQRQRLANWRTTENPPKTDSDFARKHGITTPLGHHDFETPQRRRLAHCVGF